MADSLEVGDKVSWNWNGNQPSGRVGEVKAGEVTVTSHRGNEISKTGDESNPAVHIERSGNDVVKKASELNIDEKAPDRSETGDKMEESNTAPPNGANGEENKGNNITEKPSENKEKDDEAKTGEKRKADDKADANEKESPPDSGETVKEDEQDAKKQKTSNDDINEAAKESKKAPGRPKSNGEKTATKKEKKIPAVGKSERKTRSQGAV